MAHALCGRAPECGAPAGSGRPAACAAPRTAGRSDHRCQTLAHARTLGQRDEALALSDVAGAFTASRGRAGIINVLHGEHHLLRAAIAAQLDDPATAVRLLRDAEADGLQFSPFVQCNPVLATLRGDPGFEAWRRPRTLPGS